MVAAKPLIADACRGTSLLRRLLVAAVNACGLCLIGVDLAVDASAQGKDAFSAALREDEYPNEATLAAPGFLSMQGLQLPSSYGAAQCNFPAATWADLPPAGEDEANRQRLPADDLDPPVDTCPPHAAGEIARLTEQIVSDHCHYYSGTNIWLLSGGVVVAAAMANSRLDQALHDDWQENLHIGDIPEVLHTPKAFGEGWYTIPVFVVATSAGWALTEYPSGSMMEEWGSRSLRTIVIGAPPMVAMQWLSGASRPGETHDGSHWKPFDDDNGVSGHSFMGAIPFLSAAKMTDQPALKGAMYFGSTLAGLSRINDNHHYASQIFLGWWMAYVAATAVDHTHVEPRCVSIIPIALPGCTGIGIELCR